MQKSVSKLSASVSETFFNIIHHNQNAFVEGRSIFDAMHTADKYNR